VVAAGISGLTFAAKMRRFSPETNVELYERLERTNSNEALGRLARGDIIV
jgi:L-2-hydroxyglutarate oxidase LhgO